MKTLEKENRPAFTSKAANTETEKNTLVTDSSTSNGKTDKVNTIVKEEDAKSQLAAGQGKPFEVVNIEPKTDKQQIKFDKPALNLESTLKLVEELHHRKVQRDRLLATINNLEAFEIAQIEDGDETDSNHFQGCVLTIEDDERRKFATKNPVIIQAVAQYVNSMCIDKLAEIEAGITIPA